MGFIKIEGYRDAGFSGSEDAQVYGSFAGSYEDATTSTSAETITLSKGEVLVSVYADVATYIEIAEAAASPAAGTAATRRIIPAGVTRDFKLEPAQVNGKIAYKTLA